MKKNKFTIVVPTRDGADTLYWTLKTLIAQDYENLEILVSDNFSQDNTKEVVLSFQDKRIRYINTGKRVEMTVNYEFALSHVTEGYVHYIGSDDGMLMGGIQNVNKIVNLTQQKVIACNSASYHWANTKWAGLGTVPISRKVQLGYSSELLKHYELYDIDYSGMLSIYHKCFVHIDVINQIKNSTGGKFFQSGVPDVYSSFILPRHVKEFALSFLPISIGATSQKSNGAGLYDVTKTKELNLFFSEIKEFPLCDNLEQITLLAAMEVDALFRIEHPNKKAARVKWALPKSLLENQLKEPSVYKKNLEQIEILARSYNLTDYYYSLVNKYPNNYHKTDSTSFFNSSGLIIQNDIFNVNCKALHIENVYDFAVAMSSIINFERDYTPIFTSTPKLDAWFSKVGRAVEKIPQKIWNKMS